MLRFLLLSGLLIAAGCGTSGANIADGAGGVHAADKIPGVSHVSDQPAEIAGEVHPAAAKPATDVSADAVKSTASATAIVFQNVRLFDGEKVLPRTTVVVDRGVIVAVGAEIAVPAGATVIDGAGKTLLPGLIDSHTHTFFPGQLKQAAVFGVTTELDMAGLPQFARSLRHDELAGKPTHRCEMYSAGHPLTVKGGHPTQIPAYRNIPVIKNLQHVPMFVDDRIAEGSDFIKIVYDDAAVYGFKPEPTLSREMVAAAIKRTHAHGKLAVAHVGASDFARDAIEDGIDGLVHIFIDELNDDSLVKLAVEKKIFVVPTLTVMEYEGGSNGGAMLTADRNLSPYLNSDSVSRLNASRLQSSNSRLKLDVLKKTVRKFYEAGVPILAGSDAPNPGTAHGVSVHRELEMLVDAGLTPVDALRAATSLPAESFRLSDRGRVAVGLRADLLLVDGDPTTNVSDTRKIAGVWKKGQKINREAYRLSLNRRTKIRGQSPDADSIAAAGVVSHFDGKKITSEFGAGWQISTDRYEGGRSTATIGLAAPGAHGSPGALKIRGRIDNRVDTRWAGAIYYPGAVEMSPADLSTRKSICFWSKGDSKAYSVVVFTKRGGFNPTSRRFVSSARWKQHRISFRSLDTDGSDVTAVFIGNCDKAGPFELLIDDVQFE